MRGHGRRRPPFSGRREAGELLADAVADAFARRPDLPSPVVLGLPRGGVLVAAPVARALGAPLDVVVVRKLGHPRRPELGLGAIAEDGVRVLNEPLLARVAVTAEELDAVTVAERAELDRRCTAYREHRPRQSLAGRTAVCVDDGLATGYTALAALASARRRGAARCLLAVPVASCEAVALLRPAVDVLVVLVVPVRLGAVGQVYRSFEATPDDEVVAALARPVATAPAPGEFGAGHP